jgi:adenylate kinase
MRTILLGPPGSGKGTQAQILEKQHNAWQISTGDLLRMHRTEGTPLGKEAGEYMDRGELVPDALIIKMVEGAIEGVDSYILDGFPRTAPQAEALDQLLVRLDCPLDAVILLQVPREDLIARLSSRWVNPRTGRSYNSITMPPKVAGVDDEDGGPLIQRSDDQPATVTKRLDIYDAQTKPLVEYYRQQGKLIEVDATQNVDAITLAILSALGVEAEAEIQS